MDCQGCRDFFLGLLKFLRLEIEVLNSKIVFKICYRFYLKYLKIKLVIGLKSKIVRSAKQFRRLKDLSISLSLLEALELALDKSKEGIKLLFFWR